MRLLAVTLTMVLSVAGTANAERLADEASRRQALEHYRTGQEYMSAERFGAAAESFTAAIGKDPLLVVAHYQLGQAYMGIQRYASAIQPYQGAIEAMKALHGLEQSQRFEVDKQRQEMIRELRTELTSQSQFSHLAPQVREQRMMVIEQRVKELENQRRDVGRPFEVPAFVLLAMGSAHFRNGDRDAAQTEWESAVKTNPKYGEAHNNLAVIYMMTGRKAEAENAVKMAEKAGFKVNPQLKSDIAKLGN
jgi:Tfp pilus assembly protein PilF